MLINNHHKFNIQGEICKRNRRESQQSLLDSLAQEKISNRSIVLQLLPDPYSTISRSLVKRAENLTLNIGGLAEKIKETGSDVILESLELFKSSLSSDINLLMSNNDNTFEKVPAFLTTKNFNFVISRDSLLITLNVMNTDALVWFIVLPRTPLTKFPKNVDEISLSAGSQVFAAQKGIPLDINITQIKSEESYVFFGAQDLLTGASSKVYSFNLNLNNNYLQKLRFLPFGMVFLVMLGLLEFF